MKAKDNQSLFEVFKPDVLYGYSFFEKLKYWFKNVYWYHFKNHTIFALAGIILISVLIGDIINRPVSDIDYVICGDVSIAPEQADGINDYIISLARDVNNDGEIEIRYQALSTAGRDEYDQVAAAAEDKLRLTFADDDILLYIIDGKHMEDLAAEGAFEPLETMGIEADARFCIDITNCAIFEKLGIPTASGGWYIGAKMINAARAEDEEIMRKYELVFDIISAFAKQ